MEKMGWIVLSAVAMVGSFTAGVIVGENKRLEDGRPRGTAKAKEKDEGRDSARIRRAINDGVRRALAEKEERILAVERELGGLREKAAFAPGPPRKEGEVPAERLRALREKASGLRHKILQRRDEAQRQEALAELADLLRSGSPEDILLGLATLRRLAGLDSHRLQDAVLSSATLNHLRGFDREGLKKLVLDAAEQEDAEVRQGALGCLPIVCSKEEYLNALVGMAGDASPEIRREVAERMGFETKEGELGEDIVVALKRFLQDDDMSVRMAGLGVLSRRHEYAAELEDMAIELSRETENAERMIPILAGMGTVGAKSAKRLVEMFDEGYDAYQLFDEGMHWCLSEDAKVVVRRFALGILRESVEPYDHWMAFRTLFRIGDDSILAELEEMSRGADAEGIEERLAGLIEHTRINYVDLPREDVYEVLDEGSGEYSRIELAR